MTDACPRCVMRACKAFAIQPQGLRDSHGASRHDAARRVVGRKRHASVSTDGRLLLAAVSPADLCDRHGGAPLLQVSHEPWPFFRHCDADGTHAGPRVADATAITVEIIGAKPGKQGFAMQARRLIERTFGSTGC